MSHEIVFNVVHLKGLVDQSKFEDAKIYLKKFFFKSGTNMFFKSANGSYKEYIKNDYLDLIPKEIEKVSVIGRTASVEFSARSYLQTTDFLQHNYMPIVDFSTDENIIIKNISVKGVNLEHRYLNMSYPLKIDATKEIKINDKLTKKLNVIHEHIKKVICSDNAEQYEYLLNFFSCTLNGRKLRKCLYLQSMERTGKGQVIKLLTNILGDRAYKSSSVEDILTYSKNFEGRALVNLDEMPVDGGNFKSISDKLKGLITENTFTCRDMYSKGYAQANTFNIIITTNNDAINLTQSNNMRYMCPDIDESMIGNTDYFNKLESAISDGDVQILFYQEMQKRFKGLDNWNEDIVPDTSTKTKKKIEALPKFIKWLKEEYVLRGLGIDADTNSFFQRYYDDNKDNISKQKIGRYMTDLGITHKRTGTGDNREYRYEINHEELYKAFQEKKWIDEDVDHVVKSTKDKKVSSKIFDTVITSNKEMITISMMEMKKLYEEYEELKRKVAEKKDINNGELLKKALEENEKLKEEIDSLKNKKKEKKMKIVRNLEGDDVAEEKEEVSNIEKKEDTILPKKKKKIETKNIDGDNSKLLDSLGFIVMG